MRITHALSLAATPGHKKIVRVCVRTSSEGGRNSTGSSQKKPCYLYSPFALLSNFLSSKKMLMDGWMDGWTDGRTDDMRAHKKCDRVPLPHGCCCCCSMSLDLPRFLLLRE